MRHVAIVLSAPLLILVSSATLAADPCALVTRTEASALLGQPSAPGAKSGPARDEDSSGQLSYCTYKAGTAALIVSLVEFSSPAEAKKALTANLVKRRIGEDDAKVTEEAGIAERAFYAVTAEGSMYVFIKGSTVVGLGIGGPGSPKAATVKGALKANSIAVAAKL